MNNKPNKGSGYENNPERFESDTQKIVHRHLEDKNHVISEEELRSVRVGLTPPLDELHNSDLPLGTDERTTTTEDNSGTPLTPWDSVEPK